MRALIYARVSSDPTGRGRSVADQIAACRELCQREGWEIRDVLQDNDIGASRYSRKDRPEYRKLRDQVEHVDVLVTWEASRAHRDLEAYLELRNLCSSHGVLWSYSGRTYDLTKGDDRFTTGLDALMAEREAEVIRERVLRGLRSRAAAGEPHGRIPYGYRRAVAPDGTITRVPNDEEAAVLRAAANSVRAGETLRSIAKRLNDDGRMNRGREWTPIELRRKLVSPTYAGFRVHNGRQIPATWQPIFSSDEHDAILAVLTDPRRLTQHGSAPTHLLTGIGFCGRCGGKLGRNKNKSGTLSYACRKDFCTGRLMSVVDEIVEAVVVARLSRPDVSDLLTENDNSDEFRAALSEVRALKSRLAAFESKAVAGELDPDEYLRLRDGIRAKLVDAELRTERTAPNRSRTVAEIAGPDAPALWSALPVAAKRDVVRSLATIYVDPAPPGQSEDPQYVRIEWKG